MPNSVPIAKLVYLTLRDGGFGDADGIENGIIVDPLTVGTESAVDGGSGSDSDSAIEDFMERILPASLLYFCRVSAARGWIEYLV